MKQLYCVKCGVVQNTFNSINTETTILEDGEGLPIINISYFCETCNIFIESEIKPDKYSDYESNNKLI